MKNINRIISGLSNSGLLSKMARGHQSGGGLLSNNDGNSLNTNSGTSAQSQKGALGTIGGLAWKAYQVYSGKSYSKGVGHRNVRLHQAYAQQSHLQNVYLQRKLTQQLNAHVSEPDVGNNKSSNKGNHTESATTNSPAHITSTQTSLPTQSRYIPSGTKQTLTYSPSSLSRQQFDQALDDKNNDAGQMLMLQAMIAAANADGHIDEDERQVIYQQVDTYDLSISDKASLFEELRRPLSLEELVNKVPNPQTAVEVYAVSLLAIDEAQTKGGAYLRKLATLLAIPSELVSAVHSQSTRNIKA